MKYIDIEGIKGVANELKEKFRAQKPFKYVVFENFFLAEKAEEIYQSYPTIKEGKWDGTTYIDQKNKFQKTDFEKNSTFDKVFRELNSAEFLKSIENITGLEGLKGDDELFGGGLHQSVKGAFLNVHVDYNIHPKTKYHRRLNIIIYLNKDWKDEYEGHLELWDFTEGNKILLDRIAPTFNRCVIFETNEISYHGHPKKLNTPEGVNRKSLAAYYYTETRPEVEIAEEHNTVYINTEGVTGSLKRFRSGIKALIERIRSK
ncbi:hypothetical protein Fleli_1568 [Sporocytophaga myxococcoides]|uniref:Prolyl 4-hydroxylase alpha subunit Fe(2+) 2OG dioxygenase domain-containing protein n=1 Tax=Sporocytophaga myxococcoides TaxID=153721 RepID=A0A098LBJ7_9BACT|nr:2OG-Fe(II) oxygenase [Sporocytophaga myxococcoides]GAL83777.1 hypothetical protein Fleli_1568 [Sporocytophaga myxococcoides]